jgi:uncharacterized protein YjeT (DUF2065 family)
MEFFLCVIGMVLIVEGVPYFLFPERMKSLMSYIQQQDDRSLRIMGAVFMLLGLLVVFLARSGLSAR